jgi:hypothetical protein
MAEFIHKIDEMKLKFMRQKLGDVTLEDCVALAQQAEGYLEFMPVTDPAWQHFTAERYQWWRYAWLISSETGLVDLTSPHVKFRTFLVGFPKKQPNLDDCIYRDWLRAKEETEITVEFAVYMPVYLRDNEIVSYAIDMYHKCCNINGRLQNIEMLETETEN